MKRTGLQQWMRKCVATTLLFVLVLALSAQNRAKYVFCFIGDGMGVNQVNMAETYLSAIKGNIGTEPLCFPSFPHVALVNTQSSDHGITDSAAGGTALATGHKTANGVLGMLDDKTTPVHGIACKAQQAGAAVGIATSVTLNHATPAAYYAHVKDRSEYYAIGAQLAASGYDFFAGADLLKAVPKKGDNQPSLYQLAERNGYAIAYGWDEWQEMKHTCDKLILLQSRAANKRDNHSIPYAVDREEGDLTLTQITQAAVEHLAALQQKKDGFFLMVEGGKIDWACHAHDMCMVQEVIDMDSAVRVAYDFYRQHPDETLVVVTADHETGGLSMGWKKYSLHLDVLQYQHISIERLGHVLKQLHKTGDDTWDKVEQLLKQNFGFWDKVELTDTQTQRLKTAYNHVKDGSGTDVETLYQKDNELAALVRDIQAECANVAWGTYDHSDGYVPCFAIGVGAERFHGRMDNTEVCRQLEQVAGWQCGAK
ncbi:MAG: alkaline phosphatase [Prevotella sp.]